MVTMDMVNRLRESLEGEKDFEELSLEEKIDDIKRCHHEKELIQIKTILDKMKTYEDGNILIGEPNEVLNSSSGNKVTINEIRDDYDIDMIEDEFLNESELNRKKEIIR